MSTDHLGVTLSNGCRITHGTAANVKRPFPDIMPGLVMNELSPQNKNFSGQLGFIEFTPEIRLPRHIHMDASKQKLVDERILVLSGVGLVEIAGKIWAVAPGTLVDARGGVPHTWTACPAGVELPNGYISEGKFTMVYEYEEPTSFYPTKSTTPIIDASLYEPFEGTSFEEIRFPSLTAAEVVSQADTIINKQKYSLRERG